jgi:AraC-like DNA-binding protein
MDRRGVTAPRLASRLSSLSGRDFIDAAQWRVLLGEAVAACPEPDVGLQIGANIRVSHTGVVGYMVLHSESLADALETYALFEQHFYGIHFAELRTRPGVWTLSWPNEQGDEDALWVQVALAALVTLLRQRFPGTCVPTHVSLSGPPPEDVGVFETFFGCPVSFESAHPGVSFEGSTIGQPDQGVLRGEFSAMRSQQDDAFSSVIRIDSPFTQRLRQILLRLISEGRPTLQSVAAELYCSPRTVQRRLEGVNLSYQQLLDRLGEQLACRYLLQTSLTLAEIGLLLGYSDQSAFTRAFRGWTGTTPARFRKTGRQVNRERPMRQHRNRAR